MLNFAQGSGARVFNSGPGEPLVLQMFIFFCSNTPDSPQQGHKVLQEQTEEPVAYRDNLKFSTGGRGQS